MLIDILHPDFENLVGVEVILCVNPVPQQKMLESFLEADCKVYAAESPEDAIEKLESHPFHVVIVEENYSIELLQMIANIPTIIRRNMFIVFIGDTVETDNRMQSFVLSVNLVVNKNDTDNLLSLLQDSMRENNFFFRTFYYTLLKMQESA